jgi:hypothetical protein
LLSILGGLVIYGILFTKLKLMAYRENDTIFSNELELEDNDIGKLKYNDLKMMFYIDVKSTAL